MIGDPGCMYVVAQGLKLQLGPPIRKNMLFLRICFASLPWWAAAHQLTAGTETPALHSLAEGAIATHAQHLGPPGVEVVSGINRQSVGNGQ